MKTPTNPATFFEFPRKIEKSKIIPNYRLEMRTPDFSSSSSKELEGFRLTG